MLTLRHNRGEERDEQTLAQKQSHPYGLKTGGVGRADKRKEDREIQGLQTRKQMQTPNLKLLLDHHIDVQVWFVGGLQFAGTTHFINGVSPPEPTGRCCNSAPPT